MTSKNKKAALAMEQMIVLGLLLIAFVVIIMISSDFFSSGQKNMEDTQEGVFNDEDKDGIPNTVDRCPGTDPGLQVNVRGCAPNQQST